MKIHVTHLQTQGHTRFIHGTFKGKRNSMRPIRKLLPLIATIAIAALATASTTMTCTLTGKEVKECCSTMKDGKMFCKLAQKSVDKCCCKGM